MFCRNCGKELRAGLRFCGNCGVPVAEESGTGPARDEAKTPSPPRPVDPMIGRNILGQFIIRKRLGEGGMGTAYLADQVGMDRLAVVKVLHPHLLGDPRWVDRFNREAKIASKMNHPNSITLYNYGRTEEGYVYIAMEYIDGPSLSSIIEKERHLDVERATQVAIQIGGALQQAHEMGIVHRDLKPDNILVTSRGKQEIAKVLDFGIAKVQGSGAADEKQLTATGMIFGTPAYMSPEQFAGGELDGRSDLYSLGVIIYEMLTGRRPFQASTPIGYFRLHQDEIPPPMRVANPEVNIPRDLERAVFKLLEKDRDHRYSDADELCHELELALAKAEVESNVPDISFPAGEALPGRDLPMAVWLDQLERSSQAPLPHPPSAGRPAPGLSSLLDRLEAEAAASSSRLPRDERSAPARVRVGGDATPAAKKEPGPVPNELLTPTPDSKPPAPLREGAAVLGRIRPKEAVLVGGSVQRLDAEPPPPSAPKVVPPDPASVPLAAPAAVMRPAGGHAKAAQAEEAAAPAAAQRRPSHTPPAKSSTAAEAAPAAAPPASTAAEEPSKQAGDDDDVAVIIDSRDGERHLELDLPSSAAEAAPSATIPPVTTTRREIPVTMDREPASEKWGAESGHRRPSPAGGGARRAPSVPPATAAAPAAAARPSPAPAAEPALFSYRTERREDDAHPTPLTPPPASPTIEPGSRSRVRPAPLMAPLPPPRRSPYIVAGVVVLLLAGVGLAGVLYGPELVGHWRSNPRGDAAQQLQADGGGGEARSPGAPGAATAGVEEHMVLIPASTYVMGHKDVLGAPPHPVELGAFLVDRQEVTNSAYRPCVTTRHCFDSAFVHDPTFNGPDLPVVGVSYDDAQAYCRWRGRRLPTEAEWERAARGPAGFQWPWGNAFKVGLANVAGAEDGAAQSAAASDFAAGASAEGLLNLAGNVAEWVADSYGAADRYPTKAGPDPRQDGDDGLARTRGGSWVSEPEKTMAPYRGDRLSRDARKFSIGFRCAGAAAPGAASAEGKGGAN